MRRVTLTSVAALAAAATLLSGVVAHAQPAATANPAILAATPYMGWDTYFALPGGFPEAVILQQADRLKRSGLQAKGYRLIWLDAGWWQGQRDPAGNMIVNPAQWPHGIAWLAKTLHQNGFQLGVYTDAGSTGCGVHGGSFGHYQQDMNTLAAWGVDAVKVDWCGGVAATLDPMTQYGQIHQAIIDNSSHRKMLLNICNFLQPSQKSPGVPLFPQSVFASYSFGPIYGNSWRTDTDVGAPGNVPFGSVLRNMDADATSPLAAGPGHWNDPDYLGPDQGMNNAQFQTQFSMWAMLSAPLMISDNMTTMSGSAFATVSNANVIAIDQDTAGVQATIVANTVSGNTEAWIKALGDRSFAVALLNRGATAAPMSVTAATLQAPGAGLTVAPSYTVTNAWTNQHSTIAGTGTISAQLPAYSTVLLTLTPAR
jgi:alpha-galactosidase